LLPAGRPAHRTIKPNDRHMKQSRHCRLLDRGIFRQYRPEAVLTAADILGLLLNGKRASQRWVNEVAF